ncbi:unnamed protein product [Clonostachys byssicola]|uniref:Uncharacterized protein n=1 Tax=Clonostachys byssicola TaxID=160290 RepID=A0A9N9UDS0_9HYPO|nr:unnamed protein product [Clonostachys byssicola]
MVERTDPSPSGSSQQSGQRSPESQGRSRDSRRGGRASWREGHSSGPYHQRPHRAGSAQSGLATSSAANQYDEAVVVTASNGDAAAPAGAPTPPTRAMTDLRLDEVPSASNTNVPQQNLSGGSDHGDRRQVQGAQSFDSFDHGPVTFVIFANPNGPPPEVDYSHLRGGPPPDEYGITCYGYRDSSGCYREYHAPNEANGTVRFIGGHQSRRSDTLVQDFGYPAGNAQRHLEADDQRDA